MEKSTPIKFIKFKFSIYLYIILIFKEFIKYNNKPDIYFKIEIIKICKIN